MGRGTSIVKVEGLNRLLKKLRYADPIYAEPWRAMMAGLAERGHELAVQRAPRLTGHTAGSVTHTMHQWKVPLWVKISNDATSERGVRYPFVLNAGHRRPSGRGLTKNRRSPTTEATIKLHYRGTGKSTRRWFSGVLTILRRELKSKLADTARAVEAQWAK